MNEQMELFDDRLRQAVLNAALADFCETYPRHSCRQYNDALHAIRQDLGLERVVPARVKG